MIDTDPQEFAEELRNEPTVNLFTSTKQLQKVNLENIVEISTYSSLYKLLRITGLIVRFRDNLKLCPLKNLDELKYGEVSTEEVHTAECLWIRSIQESLSNEKNYDQLHAQLGLFRDGDGTVRCRGRIEKFPAFLPRNHPLTTIIIRQCHQDVFHNGLKSTLNELRPKFWTTKARHHVKSVLRNCTICRRYEAKPYVYTPPCAELPEFRVRGNVAFMNIGTDQAGPLFTRYTLKDTSFFKIVLSFFSLHAACLEPFT